MWGSCFSLAGELNRDAGPVGKVAGPVADGGCFFMIRDEGGIEFCDCYFLQSEFFGFFFHEGLILG